MPSPRAIESAAIAVLAGALIVAGGSLPVLRATAAPGAAPTPIVYQSIDPGVYVKPSIVARWAATHNEPATYAHAARLWTGLTAYTNQSIAGVPLPVFETWYTRCDVYPIDRANVDECGQPTAASGPRRPVLVHHFEVPRQFFHKIDTTPGSVFSDNKYNQELVNYVRPYANGSLLASLIAKGTAETPDNIDYRAIATKPVYTTVSGSDITVLQVWKGPGLRVPPGSTTSSYTPSDTTWKQIVVVVPPSKWPYKRVTQQACAAVYDENGNKPIAHQRLTFGPNDYTVLPLAELYSLPQSLEEQQQLRAARARFVQTHPAVLRAHGLTVTGSRTGATATCTPPDPATIPNPRNALVAMHVLTAELDHTWTWQTFWFQPHLSHALPGAKGPFRHFDVATAYWKVDVSGKNRFAFNPYLEAPFGTCVFNTQFYPSPAPGEAIPPACTPTPGIGPTPPANPVIVNVNLGRTTNCISCHSIATYTTSTATPQPGYAAHDSQPQTAPSASIKTLNLWSLADHAGTPAPAPSSSP